MEDKFTHHCLFKEEGLGENSLFSMKSAVSPNKSSLMLFQSGIEDHLCRSGLIHCHGKTVPEQRFAVTDPGVSGIRVRKAIGLFGAEPVQRERGFPIRRLFAAIDEDHPVFPLRPVILKRRPRVILPGRRQQRIQIARQVRLDPAVFFRRSPQPFQLFRIVAESIAL